MKPFRFGINARTIGTATEWTERARAFEDQGYATLNLPDHLVAMLAPLPALAMAAAATRRLRVGTMVLNNDFRHQVVLARGEPVTFTGQHYRVTGHTIHPRPVQRPRPPILIGGNGPRLLTLAATEADIVGLTGITFARGGVAPDFSGFRAADVDTRAQLVRDVAGDRFAELELSALLQRVMVGDRRTLAAELVERWSALSVEDVLASPFVLLGSVDEMVDQLQRQRARWGLSYYIVQEPWAAALTPVVSRLTGL